MLLFGDPCQLRPVCASFPWEEPQNEKHKRSNMVEPIWEKFQPIILRTNHRQGEDLEYATMLNRFREGIFLDEDLDVMRTRVTHINSAEIPEERMYIFAENTEVNQINDACLEAMEGELFTSKARVEHRTNKGYKPRIAPGGQVGNTNLQDNLRFKIGSKVMLTYNLKVNDGLTNGALGVVVGVETNSSGKLKEIHVHFSANVGKETSTKFFPHLKDKYGVPCVAIYIMEQEYRITRDNTGVKSTATAYNFPLKLAHAITSHKVNKRNEFISLLITCFNVNFVGSRTDNQISNCSCC